MNKKLFSIVALCMLSVLSFTSISPAQNSTASISGTVTDEKQSVIANAKVTVLNKDTGFTRNVQTDDEGRYNFVNLPIGSYEVTVEAPNFSKYLQTGITLVVNQNAVIDASLKAGSIQEVVTVSENASLLNTTTAEVSTRFDEKRLSELPIAPNRNVYNVLLSVPGVSQLSSGQNTFANGISFSSNGGRLRSNNFMLDGQDINDPSLSGGQIAINNPDAIGEVRIITNQFLAEYGRNSGSVVNFIGKSGTNDFHGSAFIFHNNEKLNACSNLDKQAGFCNPNATDPAKRRAPLIKENQFGFTFGGPLPMFNFGEGGSVFKTGRDKTFFFGDFQRWTQRAAGSGFTINGAPTDAGRAILQQFANRPQVAALLNYLPAGAPNGLSRTITVNGVNYTIPLGNITGSSSIKFDSNQGSFRLDHRFNENNIIYGRYRGDNNTQTGAGQVTPPGLTTVVPVKTKAATIVLNSILSSKVANEARVSWSRFDATTTAENPASEAIPSIEIGDLGLTGFNAAASRTAIGLAVNLPQFRINDTYQVYDALSYTTGSHNLKFGIDLRRTDVKSFFIPTVRGRLSYTSLQTFVDDVAEVATINLPLKGGDRVGFYRWYEAYGFAQDEWKITPNFTLTYGLRYEYPGDSFSYLKEASTRIVAANGGDQRFALTPVPQVDKNNFMPRVGFSWNPRTSEDGVIGFLTGGDKLVVRGGYSRTYDANYINLNLNIAGGFPYLASLTFGAANAFTNVTTATAATVANPNLLTRTVVDGNFRSPSTDQFSFDVQRELSSDLVMTVGYIHTRGRGLFQTIDANPRQSCLYGTGAGFCNTTGFVPFTNTAAAIVTAPRVDATRGVIRLRGNFAESDYHALQTSLTKRLSRNFSAGVNYTYSSFIDTASETFNPSNAEVAVAQDSFNLKADRARSSFDRPHRLSGNFVYELPFFQGQRGFVGRALGGFQINSFFTLQSGAPFTVLNGSDPAGALSGIDGLVGNAIRANSVTNQPLGNLTIPEIRALCGASVTIPGIGTNACPNLFSRVQPGQRVGTTGRNILRAQRLRLVDFGIIKNTRISENVRFQIRADMFNVFNERNFGVPEGRISAASFLNQWATNGGNRRIILGGRLVF